MSKAAPKYIPTRDIIAKSNRAIRFKTFEKFDLEDTAPRRIRSIAQSFNQPVEDNTQISMPSTMDFDTCRRLYGAPKMNTRVHYFNAHRTIFESLRPRTFYPELLPSIESETIISIGFYLHNVQPILLFTSLLFSSYWLWNQRLNLIECAINIHFNYLQTLNGNKSLINHPKYLHFDALSKSSVWRNHGETPLIQHKRIEHDLYNYNDLLYKFKSSHLPSINYDAINSMSCSFRYDRWDSWIYRFCGPNIDSVFHTCYNYVNWTNDILLIQHKRMYINFICNSQNLPQIFDLINLHINVFNI